MSFSCQRCRQPLQLAPSVSSELDLNQSAYDLVQDSFIAHGLAAPAPPTPHSGGAGAGANSLSSRLAASSALSELLSAPRGSGSGSGSGSGPDAKMDHPLCKECTDNLLEIMDAEMTRIRSERDAYLAFEAELRRYGLVPPKGKEKLDAEAARKQEEMELQLRAEIEKLELDEKNAIAELENAENDRLEAEKELREVDEEEKALQQEEEKFWAEYSEHSLKLDQLVSQQRSLETALSHDRELLKRLQSTNVYNDAFCIGHDGGFATINGLRLGRLPGANVEWSEINAAWGQTALLLDTLARKLGVTFKHYKIVPKGSFSTIHRLDGDRAVYELYGSGDWQISRMLQSRRFDHGMVAFLDCLKQLASWAEERNLRLPHAINKDRIGEASIRLQFGQDETWTRALRHVLLTLKVLLSWTVQNEESQSRSVSPA